MKLLHFLCKIAQSEQVKENLSKVYELYQSLQDDETISDFTMLQWAWDDLDYRNDYQYYWEGANKVNIEAIVIETAKKWLDQNQEHHAQHQVLHKQG